MLTINWKARENETLRYNITLILLVELRVTEYLQISFLTVISLLRSIPFSNISSITLYCQHEGNIQGSKWLINDKQHVKLAKKLWAFYPSFVFKYLWWHTDMISGPDIMQGIQINVFYFLHEHINHGYSLELPHWCNSNEYTQLGMFLYKKEIRKMLTFFQWKKKQKNTILSTAPLHEIFCMCRWYLTVGWWN